MVVGLSVGCRWMRRKGRAWDGALSEVAQGAVVWAGQEEGVFLSIRGLVVWEAVQEGGEELASLAHQEERVVEGQAGEGEERAFLASSAYCHFASAPAWPSSVVAFVVTSGDSSAA